MKFSFMCVCMCVLTYALFAAQSSKDLESRGLVFLASSALNKASHIIDSQ